MVGLDYYSDEEVQRIGKDICSKMPDTYSITRFGKEGFNCIVIPDKYLPEVGSNDVATWNFSCAMIKAHPYFMMSFINDRTGERKFVSIVFCPIRYYFDDKCRQALKGFVNIDNQFTSQNPRIHNLWILSESIKYIFDTAKSKDSFLSMSNVCGCCILSSMRADIKPLKWFVESNNELGGKGLMTDVFIKNTSIDACIDCQKGKKLLESGTIPVIGKDIVLTPEQQEIIDEIKKELMKEIDDYEKTIR